MCAFASKYEQVKNYLPDEDDSFELPRWWLANLFNSVIGEAFSKWVREQVEKRNAKRKLDQNNEVATMTDTQRLRQLIH